MSNRRKESLWRQEKAWSCYCNMGNGQIANKSVEHCGILHRNPERIQDGVEISGPWLNDNNEKSKNISGGKKELQVTHEEFKKFALLPSIDTCTTKIEKNLFTL